MLRRPWLWVLAVPNVLRPGAEDLKKHALWRSWVASRRIQPDQSLPITELQ